MGKNYTLFLTTRILYLDYLFLFFCIVVQAPMILGTQTFRFLYFPFLSS